MPHIHYNTHFMEVYNHIRDALWGKFDAVGPKVFTDFQFDPETDEAGDDVVMQDLDDELDDSHGDGLSSVKHPSPQVATKLSLVWALNSSKFGSDEFLLPCDTNEMLVRNCYIELREILEEKDRVRRLASRPTQHEKYHLIIGQPGIGKTWFLSYILVHRLLLGKRTILQVSSKLAEKSEGLHFLFDAEGVHEMNEAMWEDLMRETDIWVLADRKPLGPATEFHCHHCFVLQTSSPNPENYEKLKKQYQGSQYVVPSWSWEEVVAASCLDSLNLKINFRRDMRKLFISYGPVPRILFEMLLRLPHNDLETEQRELIEENVEVYERDLRQKVKLALRLDPEVLFSLNADRSFSTRLILLRPIPHRKWKYIASDYEATLMTPYIAAIFSEASNLQQTQRAKYLYEFLLSTGAMRSAAGWVFESRVHMRFERGGNFAISSLSGAGTLNDISINLNSTLGTKVPTFVFNQLSQLSAQLRLTKGLPDINTQMFNVYLRRDRCNLESIDALTIIEDTQTKKPRLVCFQITVASKHGIKAAGLRAAGLRAIWKAMPASAKKLKPAVVFVVPAETADRFSAQRIEGREPQDQEWTQYALAMTSEELWWVKTF